MPQRITLQHHTLLLLVPETNRLFLHSVKKSKGDEKDAPLEPRISITFRNLATGYVTNGTGVDSPPALYGQGTPQSDFEAYSKAQARKKFLAFTGIVGISCATFFDANTGSNEEKRHSPWLGVAAAGIAAVASSMLYTWRKQCDWQWEQKRLGEVYHQCNVQALLPAQAKDMLLVLHGTDKELDFGMSKVKPSSNTSGRDS